MNLIFAGTPAFAVPALEALLRAGHTIRAVYTQPDRPAGRGRKLAASPVKQCAQTHGIEIRQPEKISGEEKILRADAPDAMIVIAYGLLLPPPILAIPRHGCINVHASLLPRWRGAAPIPRAIEAGDAETGVSIMQMEAGLDTGPVLAEARIPIHASDTAQTLHDRLAQLGADTLVATLERLARGAVTPQPQDTARRLLCQKTAQGRIAHSTGPSPPWCCIARYARSIPGRWPAPSGAAKPCGCGRWDRWRRSMPPVRRARSCRPMPPAFAY